MKILLMRSDRPKAELYLYNDQRELGRLIWQADRRLAETIHVSISQLCAGADLAMTDIEAIGVFAGPGSFTGLRIGHSVANALAYALDLPIVATAGEHWQKAAIKALLDGQNQKLVAPSYGQPVHITKPKK